MHASLKFGFTSFSSPANLLRIVCRNTVYIPLLLFFTKYAVKAEEVERLRLPSPRLCRLLIGKRTKLQQPRFLGDAFQEELLIRSVSSARNWIGIRFAC